MTIATKNELGYLVKVSYELKDIFKSHFKTAKWNSEQKMWQIGSRSLKKWELFCEQTKIQQQQIDEINEEEFNQNELENLKKSLENINTKINDKKYQFKKSEDFLFELQKVKDEISSKKQELIKAEEQLKLKLEEENNEKKEIHALISKVCNINIVKSASDQLAHAFNLIKHNRKQARFKFDEAAEIISKERSKLKDAGYKILAIEQLSYANFNKPNRDHPRLISEEKWYQIEKIV